MLDRMLAGLAAVAALALALPGDAATPAPAAPAYQPVPGWPTLPNNWLIGDTAAVVVDHADHVWILHRPHSLPDATQARSAPPLIEFDTSGKFIRGWGGPADGYEWPMNEHSLYVDGQDRVWIGGTFPFGRKSDVKTSDDQLLVFTVDGKFLRQYGHEGASGGDADTKNFKEPADIFVDLPHHETYVADGYGNRRIIVIDSETGAFKRMWGAFGNPPMDPGLPPGVLSKPAPMDETGDGSPQFGHPHSVALSKDGLVYLADRSNRRVQVFTPAGKYVTQVFINRAGPAQVSAVAVAFSPDPAQRWLYVADYGNSVVMILDRKTLTEVGRFGSRGTAPGQFQGLHDIAVDSHGDIYTTEVAPGSRVQKFALQPAGR